VATLDACRLIETIPDWPLGADSQAQKVTDGLVSCQAFVAFGIDDSLAPRHADRTCRPGRAEPAADKRLWRGPRVAAGQCEEVTEVLEKHDPRFVGRRGTGARRSLGTASYSTSSAGSFSTLRFGFASFRSA
jgi:hypothetical protein